MGSVLYTANFALANLTAPASGVTHAIKLAVSVNNDSVKFSLDSLAQTIGDFNAQAMTVDNTAGSAAVVVSETTFGWSRTIDAGVGQTFQFPAVPHPVFIISSTGSTVGMSWTLFDWPAFPDAWNDSGNAALATNVNIVSPNPLSVQGLVQIGATQTAYTVGAAFAVAVGGTAVVAFAGGSITRSAYIKNPDSATESLFIDFVNVAQTAEPGTHGTCFALAPGASFTFGPDIVPTTNVSVNAATNGHAFVAVMS